MQRVTHLIDQADLLRRMASSFKSPSIQQDLLNLARRCDELADRIRSELVAEQSDPA